MEQRVLLDDMEAGRRLGCLALEELEPRRRVREEVADLHHRPRRGTRGALVEEAARPQVNAAARARALDIGNRRDAGKRLAPEAKRPDRLEVGERPDLARRVALKGQRELFGGYPGAIVDNSDQVAARAPDFDRDPAGTGVEGVLDQLFDN